MLLMDGGTTYALFFSHYIHQIVIGEEGLTCSEVYKWSSIRIHARRMPAAFHTYVCFLDEMNPRGKQYNITRRKKERKKIL